jgi:hypothetical protein
LPNTLNINKKSAYPVASNPRKRKIKQQLQQLREGRPEEAVFDAWFDGLPGEQQAHLRAQNPPIIPYREMPFPRYAFPLYANDTKFASADPRHRDELPDDDGWVSRERVGEIISDVIAMLGASPDRAVQAHIDLVKIILQTSDAPTQQEIAERLGLTKQAVSVRVKKLAANAALIAPGLLTRIKDAAVQLDYNELNDLNDRDMTERGAKKSITPTPGGRGASTTAKKHGFSPKGGQETHQG